MSSACVQAQCTEHTNKDLGVHRQQQKAPPPQDGQCDGSPTPEALNGLGSGDASWTCAGSEAIARSANMDYYFEKYVYAADANSKDSHSGSYTDYTELAAARNFARKACVQNERGDADPWAKSSDALVPSVGGGNREAPAAGRSCRKQNQYSHRHVPQPIVPSWPTHEIRFASRSPDASCALD